MCFSTAREVSTSVRAIAALFFPCAISDSTSRSRGVSCASGERAACVCVAIKASTTLGSTTEPPRATSPMASTNASGSNTRSFSHRAQQRVQVTARGHHLDIGLRLEEPLHTLTYEQVVLGEHDAQRHGPPSIRPRRSRRESFDDPVTSERPTTVAENALAVEVLTATV